MFASGRRTTRLIGAASVAVLALVVLLPGSGASADTAADQREVKRKRAEVAAQIDTLQATNSQLDAALADLQANVSATLASMNDAQARVTAATARAAQAERDAAETEASIEKLRGQVVEAAVAAYVDPAGDQALDVFRENSANDASTKQALIDATSGAKLDVVDEYRSEKQRLDDLKAEAETARAQAESQRDALAQKKSGYDAALAQQQQVANEVSSHISDRLAESAALATLDSNLSTQLAQEQAALAARVAASRSSANSGNSGRRRRRRKRKRRRGRGRRAGHHPTGALHRRRHHRCLLDRRTAGLAAQRRLGRRLPARGQRLPRLQRPDRAPPPELRDQQLRHLPDAAGSVLAAHGHPRSIEARAGSRRGLHHRWAHAADLRRRLRLDGRQRRQLRLREPPR